MQQEQQQQQQQQHCQHCQHCQKQDIVHESLDLNKRVIDTNIQNFQQHYKQQAVDSIAYSIKQIKEQRKLTQQTADRKLHLIPFFFEDLDNYKYIYTPKHNHQRTDIGVEEQRINSLKEKEIGRKGAKHIIQLCYSDPDVEQLGDGSGRPFYVISPKEKTSDVVSGFCIDLQITLYRLAATKEDIDSIIFSEKKGLITCTCTLIYK